MWNRLSLKYESSSRGCPAERWLLESNTSPQRHKVHKGNTKNEFLKNNAFSSLCFLCVLCAFVVNLFAEECHVCARANPEAGRRPLRRSVAAAPVPSRCRPRCLLYTSDAADDLLCVDLGGRRIIKK